jgi:hypothetical protein
LRCLAAPLAIYLLKAILQINLGADISRVQYEGFAKGNIGLLIQSQFIGQYTLIKENPEKQPVVAGIKRAEVGNICLLVFSPGKGIVALKNLYMSFDPSTGEKKDHYNKAQKNR